MKNFNLFEKLWEHGRTLRRVGLVLVMCLITITQAWATSGVRLRGDYVGGFSYTSATWTKAIGGDETKRYWDVYHSGGSKYWRIWLDYYNHDGGPDNENEDYDLNVGTPAYMVVNKNKHSFVTTADPGILRIKVDQYGSDKGRSKDEYPYVWVERPDVEFKYPWNGGSDWTLVTATDNHDGTYTYRGTYRGVDRFNAGPNGADKIAPEGTGEGTTVIIGSPTTGRRCEFKWQPGTGDTNTDYRYTGGEEENRGRFTITKLCTITYYANGGTGDAPDPQEVLFGADQTLRGNTGSLAKTDFVFVGWNTASDGSGEHYDVGATLEDVEADVDLYAEWVSGKWGVKGSGGDGALGNWNQFKVLRQVDDNVYRGSVSLGAHQVYEFKITDNTTWYGRSDISKYFLGQTNSVTLSSSPSEANCIIATGNEGDYTFEFDESTGGLIVTYPNGNNHPSTNFVYYSNPNNWGTIKAYIYDDPQLTDWNNSPILGTPVTISGASYYYTALGDRNDVIFHNGSGNKTSDIDEADDEVGHYYNTSWAQFTVRITLNNQSATSAGTEYKEVKFNYDELTTSIICPTKTGYNFGGYYTEENGEGEMIINSSGVWQESVAGYTDASKRWIKDGGNATLYAKWTEKTWSVNAVVSPAGSGYATPSSATSYGQVTGGAITASENEGYDFYKWKVTSGAGTIGSETTASTTFYPTSASTVTAQFCPESASGKTVYKFEVADDVGTDNVCASASTNTDLTVANGKLSTMVGGTLTAYTTNTSNLKYATNAISYVNGTAGQLILNLDCALATGDIIRFVNYSSNNSKYNYLRHTSSSTEANQLTLNASRTAGTVQQVVVPDAFNGKSVLYIVAGSNTTAISSIEIIRPYTVTLDATTNGGTVTPSAMYFADGESQLLPRATKSSNRFKGWYTEASNDVKVSDYYSPTGSTTLYAQFEDCATTDATVYKFQVKTDLTNGNVPNAIDINQGNYLSELFGGTLSDYNSDGSKVSIVNNNAIKFNDNQKGYLIVNLDCALQRGDKIITSTSGTGAIAIGKTLSSSECKTTVQTLVTGDAQEATIVADLEGVSTLYIRRNNSDDVQITSFEIYRPEACTGITPTFSTGYTSTTLTLGGGTSSTPVIYKDGSEGAITWTSSDEAVATVNSSGVVTPVKVGSTTITATVAAAGGKCEGSVSANFTIKGTVTYHENGGSGSVPTDANTYAKDASVTVAGKNTLTKTNYVFAGWNTKANGSGTWYDPSSTLTMGTSNVDLYAQWQQYAVSIDLVEEAAARDPDAGDKSKKNYTYLTNNHYLYSTFSSTEYENHTGTNDGYKGLKLKDDGAKITFYVPTGKKVTFLFGYIDNSSYKPSIKINDVAKDLPTLTYGNSASNHQAVTYTTTTTSKIELKTTSSGTVTLQAILIEDPCAATANAGADKATVINEGVAMAATAASSGYTGAWSIKTGSPNTSTTQLSSTSSATATFTPTAAGTYTLIWTVTEDGSGGSCSASDEVDVVVSCTNPVESASITPTYNSAVVTLSEGARGYGYKIKLTSEAVGAAGTVTEWTDDTYNSYEFTGLTPNTTYTFHVKAKGSGECISDEFTKDFTTSVAPSFDVTHSLTNVSYSSGDEAGTDAATYGTDYSVTFAADPGYALPVDIAVTIGGAETTADTEYTWNSSTGELVITGTYITGDIEIEVEGIEGAIPALITYALQTPAKGTTPESLVTTSITTDPVALKGDKLKNFTNVALGSSYTNFGEGKDKNGLWTMKIGYTPADSTTTDANSVKLSFDIDSDYELSVSSVVLHTMTVGDNNLIYRARLSDGVTSVFGRVAPSGGEDATVVFGSFSGKKFSGTVTLTLWVWGRASTQFRIKSPIQIDGLLTRKAGYSITYNLHDGDAGATVSGKTTYTEEDEDYDLPTPTWTGHTFLGWYETYNDGTGEYSNPVSVLTSGSTGDKTYHAKWATSAPVEWTITKVDSKLYAGGGGYSVTAVVDDASWTGDASSLVLSASDGVTLGTPTASTESSKKQIVADFSIGCDVEGPITFSLYAPANGSYAAIEDEEEVELDECPGGSVTNITIFDGTISTNPAPNADDGTAGLTYKKGKQYTDGTTGFKYKLVGIKDGLADISEATYTGKGDEVNAIQWGGSSTSYYGEYIVPKGYTASITVTYVLTANASKYIGFGSTKSVTPNGSNYTSNATISSNNVVGTSTFSSISEGTYYFLCSGGDKFLILAMSATLTSSDGGVATSLAWSNSQASGARVDKNDNDGDFRIYASPTPANAGGTITYSSSKTSVATVSSDGTVHIVNDGSTTITASMSAYGCYSSAEPITYSLVVANTCSDTPGTIVNNDGSAIAGNVVDRGACETLTLKLTGHSGSTIQWKKDGGNVGTNSDTYAVPIGESGVYTAVVTGACTLEATNSITVTTADGTPNPTIYADDFYVKSGKWFGYRLMKINEGETVTVKTAPDGWEENTDFFITTDANRVVSIRGKKTITTTPADKTLKLTISNACDGSVDKDITIREMAATDKPTVAWIATDSDNKGKVDKVKADESTNTSLYKELEKYYAITPRNCYWTTNEAALVKEYSQYDLIILTDYPNSQTGPNGSTSRSKSYTNAIGLLIDHKPILTFEAYVAGCPNWGIASNPQNTEATQTDLTLLCNAGDIFHDTSGKFAAGEAIAVTDASSGQALQGFPVASSPDFVFIGKITDDTKEYVACCERQHEIAARMMVFGLNSAIMSAMTDDGKTMVHGFVEYLLLDNAASIPDCSVIFTTAGDWDVAGNWEGGTLPNEYATVRIDKACVIPADYTAKAGRIKIHDGDGANGSLTVSPSGVLIVEKSISRVEGTSYTVHVPTQASDLVIQSDATGNGVLVMGSYDGTNQATVAFYTKAHKDNTYGWINQFIGTPFSPGNDIYQDYYGSYIYEFDPTKPEPASKNDNDPRWINKKRGYHSVAFQGYNILRKDAAGTTLSLEGQLCASEPKTLNLYYNGSSKTENMFANSWMAPIDVASMSDAFTNCEKTIYIFNAGSKTQIADADKGAANATSAGQYIVLPVESAPWTSPTVKVIPSMQAFSVFATGAGAKLNLDYATMVLEPAKSASKADLTAATRAPNRRMDDVNKPEIMRLQVTGAGGYGDLVYMLMRSDFTTEFENGYDGRKMMGDGAAPQMYAISDAGNMSINCVADADGTVIGFQPGEDTQYTFTFAYDGDEDMYLNDIKKNKSVQIREDRTYMFTADEGDEINRFIISATPFNSPEIATGVTDLDADAPKVQKIIYNDKLYIIRGGKVFSADGQLVK